MFRPEHEIEVLFLRPSGHFGSVPIWTRMEFAHFTLQIRLK